MFNNILHAYQLENYQNIRFLKFIYTHPKFWIFGSKRQNLIWTKKAILLFVMAILLTFICLFLGIYYLNIFFIISSIITLLLIPIFFIISSIITLLLIPIFFIISSIIIYPIDLYLKNKIIKKAKLKLLKLNKLKIIGITGSYGKTSTKEILKTILSEKYKVLTTSGNKNTPLGISEVIINKLDDTYDVFIVEMGAYIKGDIKELCNLVNPSFGILTGITYQHLERFKNIENIIATKFELIESLSSSGMAFLDISNENIVTGLKIKENKLNVKNIIKINNIETYKFLENFSGLSFNYKGINISTKLLAPHSLNTIVIGFEVAKKLGLTNKEIIKGISKINYTKHRMEPIYNSHTNIWIIDDSYNGNYEGVKSTIKLLSQINIKGNKIYLSPGLTELGNKSDEIHLEIGKMLSNVVDKVILIKNNATKMIKEGLIQKGFQNNNILLYKDTLSVHNDLGNILKSGDIIVFQNDWTDNYF